MGRAIHPGLTPRKNGSIIFNKVLCELLKLSEGDLVEFYQDDEYKNKWFFTIKEDGAGFKIKKIGRKKRVYNELGFHNKNISRLLIESRTDKSPKRIRIIEDPKIINEVMMYELDT